MKYAFSSILRNSSNHTFLAQNLNTELWLAATRFSGIGPRSAWERREWDIQAYKSIDLLIVSSNFNVDWSKNVSFNTIHHNFLFRFVTFFWISTVLTELNFDTFTLIYICSVFIGHSYKNIKNQPHSTWCYIYWFWFEKV